MKSLVLKFFTLVLVIFIMGQVGGSCQNCIDLLVVIANPVSGSTVSDMVELKASVVGSLASSVTRVKFTITGGSYPPSIFTAYPPSYSTSWDTTTFDNGTYLIKAEAYTSGGKTAESPAINVTVNNDIKWTFMVYMNGDNNLESAALDDLGEMKTVGSNNKLNVIVQLDKYNQSGCWRYKVNQGSLQLLATLEEQDFGDPNVLLDFVNWAMANYPASRYVLVIWDHGDGWRRKVGEAIKGISYDDHGGFINTVELSNVFDSISRPIHIIGMDACLMQMEEVAYQIMYRGYYLVASQETELGDGWPYDTILQELKNNPNMDISQLPTIIVDKYMASYSSGVTQSSRILYSREVAYKANELAHTIRNNPNIWETVKVIISCTQNYYYTDYKDLYDFARRLKDNTSMPTSIKNAAQSVMTAVNNVVTAEGHSGTNLANSHGISIWLPNSSQFASGRASYSQLDFAIDTEWDEMLDDLF
ncbi:MAG: clostripain-related cysteine peptidase [bacterium]